MLNRSLAVIALSALASFAEAQTTCTIQLDKDDIFRGKRYELSWNAVPGTNSYILEEIIATDENRTVTRSQTLNTNDPTPSIEVEKTTTVAQDVTYRISTANRACSAQVQVRFAPDVAFSRVAQKSIIPLVGSAPGAHGAQFKTSLRLRRNNTAELEGWLVFHPIGVPGSDADPRIRYSFKNNGPDTIEYDDIVAAFGVTGLGSIDIIPDPTPGGRFIVPFADVRLFNVADGGTYGAIEAQTQAIDFFGDASNRIRTMNVVVPGPQLRLNVGVRSVEAGSMFVSVLRAGERITQRQIAFGRDHLIFSGAAEVTGIALQPGDIVAIQITTGGAIPLYSLTDNKTNDPALYYPPTRTLLDLTFLELQ